MKTSFSRNLTTTAIILLLALVLVGTTFQALVRDYLTDNAVGQLQQNSSSLADLAAAYCSDGSFSSREFLVNLDVVSQVTGTAAVISPVKQLDYEDQSAFINNGEIGPLTQRLYDTLTGLQWGKLPDTKGWIVPVCNG